MSAQPQREPQISPEAGDRPRGQFRPGQSGNPGGRPKGLAAKCRELAPAEELTAWKVAIWQRDKIALRRFGIALKEVTLKEREAAAEWLADRGYGRAASFALVEGGDPLELADVDSAIGSVLDELADRREAKAAGGGAPPAVAGEGAAGADAAGG